MKINKEAFLTKIEKQFFWFFPLMAALFFPSKELLKVLSFPDIFIYVQTVIFIIYLSVKGRIKISVYTGLLLMLIFFAAVSIVVNDIVNPLPKIKYILRWINYFLTFVIAYNYLNENSYKEFKKGLFIAAYAICIYGILQVVFLKQLIDSIFWIKSFPDYIFTSFRMLSFLDNPLNLCAYLAFPLGVLHYLKNKTLKHKVLMALIYVALLLTASKIAVIMMLVSFFVLLKKHRKVILYSYLAIFISFIAIGFSPSLQEKLKSTFWLYQRINNSAFLEGSINQRKYIMVSSIQMIGDNPILGIGPRNFKKVYLDGYKHKLATTSNTSYTAENFFLDFYLDYGLIPCMIMLYFFITVFLTYIQTKEEKLKVLSFAILLFLLSGLIMSARAAPLLFMLCYFFALFFKSKKLLIN